MRESDSADLDFASMRRTMEIPEIQTFIRPGNVLVPPDHTAVAAVVASSVVLTVFDEEAHRGGLAHFLRPAQGKGHAPTPFFGLPACMALLNWFFDGGTKSSRLIAGVYGGAWPEWASSAQREQARLNTQVVRDVLRKKGVRLFDEDVGGHRGRKIIYMTGTNEIGIVKTDSIRQSDWFPPLPGESEAP